MKNYESAVLEAHNAVLASRGRVKNLIEERKKIALEAMRACEIFPQFTGENEEQFDETLVPYFFLIKRIKENPDKTIKEIVGIEEMENIAAALAAFEEYDLMERYIAEGNSFNVQTSVGAFRNWQPTPLYHITLNKVIDNLEDGEKLLTFLVENKADPNMCAGDDSTPLLSTCFQNKPIELMQCLLELGACPDKQGVEEGLLWYPLAYCLLLDGGENGDENNPPSREAIRKAKLLLEYGADPNKGVDDFPPLMQAIVNCDHKDIDLLHDLLERGANVNMLGNGYTLTPLLLSYDYQWFEAGQLLLLYGADMETMKLLLEKRNNRHIIGLEATVTTWFPSGAGKDSTTSKTFSFPEIEKRKQLTCNHFHIMIKEKSNLCIKGDILWQYQNPDGSFSEVPGFSCGHFNISLDNPLHHTNSLNISYETYTQLSLSLQLSDISLKEEAELIDIRIKSAPFLEGIDEELKESFYQFCTETTLGLTMVSEDLLTESIMYWFGIFAIPFKNKLYGNRFDDLFKDTIFALDFSKTPEDILETNSPYNKLLFAVFAFFYRSQNNDKERYSNKKIFEVCAEAEYECHESKFHFGDTILINLAASLYLQGTIYSGYGMEEELSTTKKECESIYLNLSQRKDLFDKKQRAVLNMLAKLPGHLLYA